MKVSEVLLESVQQRGRAFNHLEDLAFFYGSDGAREALQHLVDFTTAEGSGSIRMKWDGNPQIYWGRQSAGGPLVLAGHNNWSRGVLTDNPQKIYDFIANQSGSPRTPEEKQSRDEFAQRFAGLYPIFDAATPQDFVGFVYADGLFLEPQQPDDSGIYNFAPNPKSNTVYHVRQDSGLGKRIAAAKVMVVGHAYFPEFGMPDRAQQPIKDFSQFNGTQDLIVLPPIYNDVEVNLPKPYLTKVANLINKTAQQLDTFLQPVAGLSDLKEIIYRYINSTAKARQLSQVSAQHFLNWTQADSRVSSGKKDKIQKLIETNPQGISALFAVFRAIQTLKNSVIDQVEQSRKEIWDTNGEGRVRYADQHKQFGNVKLVPRDRWVPGDTRKDTE